MPEPLRECRERASHVISWARLSPADLRITGKSVRVALPFPLMDRQDRTCVRGGRVEGKAMGAVTAVTDPVVACAGELRGHPGPRSAAVLNAWTCQPGEPPESPVGPLDEVVDVVTAAQRLAGWAIWCQLAAAARLLLAWRKRSPSASSAPYASESWTRRSSRSTWCHSSCPSLVGSLARRPHTASSWRSR